MVLGLRPQTVQADDDLPSTIKDIHGHIENLKDAYSNYQQCVARGADPDLCQALAVYCAIPGSGLVDSRAGLFSKLDLFQSFKVDCGDGECYQCCFTGDGCHSSFVGFPVINCNANYGPETRDVGITLITDPDAQPGDSCLTTPQTCDHLSLCLGDPNSLTQLREDLDNGLEHPLNMAGAAEQRLRYFGKDFYDRFLVYLNRFHTGIPITPDPEFTSFGKLVDIDFFLTGRGCMGWRNHVDAFTPYDWSDELFVVKDDQGVASLPASQLNGVRMVGLLRLLDALPNLAGRHAAVESTVWPDVDRDAYLTKLSVDPDEALLALASPIFLDLLRHNPKVSDYRLLAVPLEGEINEPPRFNGCELGYAPDVSLEPVSKNGADASIHLTIDNPELGSPHEGPLLAEVLWGDGTVSHEEISGNSPEADILHTYAEPGRYVVYAVVENTSGLRGVASTIVETSEASSAASAPHVFAEVHIVDAIARVNVTSGNERKLFFELSGRDAVTEETLLLGISQELSIPFNEDVALGTMVGHNPGARPLDQLILRPAWRDGFYGIGWNGHYLAFKELQLHVSDTATGGVAKVEVPLTPENVRVYPVEGSNPIEADFLSQTEGGQTLIWLDKSWTAERIEIDIPPNLLAMHAPGPLSGENPESKHLVEVRPGVFEPPTSEDTDGTGGTGTGDPTGSDSSTETASSAGSDSGDTSQSSDDGGCGCTTSSRGVSLWMLAPLLLIRRRGWR